MYEIVGKPKIGLSGTSRTTSLYSNKNQDADRWWSVSWLFYLEFFSQSRYISMEIIPAAHLSFSSRALAAHCKNYSCVHLPAAMWIRFTVKYIFLLPAPSRSFRSICRAPLRPGSLLFHVFHPFCIHKDARRRIPVLGFFLPLVCFFVQRTICAALLSVILSYHLC